MEILIILTLCISVVNLILLIGLAGSMVKLIRYMSSRRAAPVAMSRQRRVLDTDGRTPTYVDTEMVRPPNWDGMREIMPNWDGMPKEE